MKQSLSLKLGQQLKMTPQLQQAIRLLQLSALELEQEVQDNLDANPLLEVEDDFAGDSGSDSQEVSERSIDSADAPPGDVAGDDYSELSKTASDQDNDYLDGFADIGLAHLPAIMARRWSQPIPWILLSTVLESLMLAINFRHL